MDPTDGATDFRAKRWLADISRQEGVDWCRQDKTCSGLSPAAQKAQIDEYSLSLSYEGAIVFRQSFHPCQIGAMPSPKRANTMQRAYFLIALLLFLHACVAPGAQATPGSPPLPTPSSTAVEMTPTSPPTRSPTPSPLPSDTPMPPPSAIPTASPTVIQTVEPRPTTEFTDAVLPGKIYAWALPFYGYLEPNQWFQEDIIPLGGQYPREQTPATAVLVAFSYYTQQIAYLLETPDQKLNLWLADLELQTPRSVWVDHENLSGYASVDDLLSIRWGPGDQFILLRNRPASGPNESVRFWLAYAITSNSTIPLTGPCDRLFISPQSWEYAIGCPITETSFVVLEQDGTQWNTESLPENVILAKDWVVSPDGKRVLYANEQDEILVASHHMGTLKLPISYKGISSQRSLQWSQDGSRLLIDGNDAERCPFSDFIGRTPPCWQVMDALTGEVLWTSSLVSGYDATLSPDGQWVVMFHADYASIPIRRWGAIYAIADNAAIIFYNWLVEAVAWGE